MVKIMVIPMVTVGKREVNVQYPKKVGYHHHGS